MGEKPPKKGVSKSSLPNLDDLLQCPVCYEVPSGHIFQCNEGHHVCGQCKLRLRNCPVCRSLFFGTRNYAMEELLANIRRLQAFKIAGKTTVAEPPVNDGPSNHQSDSGFASRATEENTPEDQSQPIVIAASRGVWRCFIGECNEKLPACRLVNHLRYFHNSSLIEARLENREYSQVWEISTDEQRLTSALHIVGVGVFWLNFVISCNVGMQAWLTMATINVNSLSFVYTLTAAFGNREYLFKDHVRTSRDSEGSLAKNRRMMLVSGSDLAEMTETIRFRLRLWREHEEPEFAMAAGWFDEPELVVRVANQPAENLPSASVGYLQTLSSFDVENNVVSRNRRPRRETSNQDYVEDSDDLPYLEFIQTFREALSSNVAPLQPPSPTPPSNSSPPVIPATRTTSAPTQPPAQALPRSKHSRRRHR